LIDFVRNSEVSLLTGLTPVSDRITRGRNAIFVHVARIPDNTPEHQVELSVGPHPDLSWKRPPNRPRTKWIDQLRRDNNNVLIAILWRQAIGRGLTRERRYDPSRLRVNDDDDDVGLHYIELPLPNWPLVAFTLFNCL